MGLAEGGAGAVRGGGPGAGVPIVQAAALLPRAVVVGHDPAACRLRVLARTRPSDAAGPRPRRRRDRLAAVLAVLAARRLLACRRSTRMSQCHLSPDGTRGSSLLSWMAGVFLASCGWPGSSL